MKSLVAIIIGSESDDKIVQESGILKMFREMGIGYEYSVISCHRNPNLLKEHCYRAVERGVRVFICIAGMAAALPGAIKSHFPHLPVIGVPLVASDGFLSGLDALLSMLRMPSGLPVIVVGLGKTGLINAAHCAIEILNMDKDLKIDLIKFYDYKEKPSQILKEHWP